MMKKIITLLGLFIVFVSCQKTGNHISDDVKPNSAGKSGEILVIISDKLWEGSTGDLIYNTLSEPFPILPQDEPFFKVLHLPKDGFKNIFKLHRNVIFINIKKGLKPKVTKQRNKWANNQLIFNFYAPDTTSFKRLWTKHKKNLMRTFFNEELDRYIQVYKESKNEKAIAQIQEKYGISLIIPVNYNLDVKKDHFAWISRETKISSQGIFIYDYPYTSPKTFTATYIVHKRDSVTKQNVPGPDPGTYMETEKVIPVVIDTLNINGQFTFVVRGLWKTKGFFLGGPFVSYTKVDTKNNRVVTVDAYVYAGKKDKKLFLWQTEAILRTFKILD